MPGRSVRSLLALRRYKTYPQGGGKIILGRPTSTALGPFSFAKAHYFRGCARRREEREHFLSVEAISTGCAASFPSWGVWC